MTSAEAMRGGLDMDRLAAGTAAVMARLGAVRVTGAAILGSGWGDATDALEVLDAIPYNELPCLGTTGVKGHKGTLILGRVSAGAILIFQGRRHWYEGLGWTPVAFPVYLAASLGARTLLLTNAAGAIDPSMRPGDLMIVRDHINLLGGNPLIGAHDPFWGERFPDQSSVYSESLQEALLAAARRHGIEPRRGVYLAAAGPVYETPAEIRAYRAMGADAVGMSTVPEAILANAAGLRTAALSCITNFAAGVGDTALHHDEVLAVSRERMPLMKAIVGDALEVLCAGTGTAR